MKRTLQEVIISLLGGWCVIDADDPRFISSTGFITTGDNTCVSTKSIYFFNWKLNPRWSWFKCAIFRVMGDGYIACDLPNGKRLVCFHAPLRNDKNYAVKCGYEDAHFRLLTPTEDWIEGFELTLVDYAFDDEIRGIPIL